MSDYLYRRLKVTMRTVHVIAFFAAGIAMACVLTGWPRTAIAAVILILFAHILSTEALRAFVVLHFREPRQ